MDTKDLEKLTDIAEHLRNRVIEIIHLISEIVSFLHKDSLWDNIGRKYANEYVKSIGDLEHIEELLCETEKVVKSLIESLQCFSAPLFSISKNEKIVEKAESLMEDVESFKSLLEGIEAVDDDDLAALEAAHEESRNISENPVEGFAMPEECSRQRRKLLAESLRSGIPMYIRSDGEVECSRPLLSGTDNCEKEVDSISASGGDTLGIQVPSGKLAGGIQRCRVCDNSLMYGANFCPYCGSKVTIEKAAVDLKKVQFSAVAPKTFVKGDYTVINIVMYEDSFRHVVDELLGDSENPAQETKSGVFRVKDESKVKIILDSPDIELDDNEETLNWQGDYLRFSFAVLLPEQYKKRQILFNANIYVNDVIATKLKFVVKCSSLREQKIAVSRADILSAFISYASQDRNRVAAIIQGMKKARPDMDIFFDVDSLRSGEDWERVLHCEIEKRDILFLCWSHFARQSKWVDEEWRYALAHKGIECIEPVPIEPPGVCPPPDELKSKHFNDKLLYIINTEGVR